MKDFRLCLLAEFVGTALLLAAVVGSGIMGANLAAGNAAVTLLANSAATAAALVVLITLLAPISGAHFNPLVTLMNWASGGMSVGRAWGYLLAQFTGAVAGVLLVHTWFALPLIQTATQSRSAPQLWLSELVSTLLLLSVVRACRGASETRAATLIALTVFVGYWATASTFFANPAVTFARSLTDTFTGIAPHDVVGFILAQVIAAAGIILVIRKR